MSCRFKKRIKQNISAARLEGLYRRPHTLDERQGRYAVIGNCRLLNFASNDYLGLGSNEVLGTMVSENFRKYGPSASSSRLVSGNYSLICEAEQAYADYFGYDEAVFFPSGYQANLAIMSTFLTKEDIAVFDKHVHASCITGLTQSGAVLKGYKHSSMGHLEKRLKKAVGNNVALITESLFSMDGDLLDTKAIKTLKTRYDFFSIIDEAHSFGVLGNKGKGIARNVSDITVGTFGKALGLFGAFVLMPEGFREYLFNFASPLIYTTALPQAHAASAIDILDIVSDHDDKREHLKQISAFMKDQLTDNGFNVQGQAHILSVAVGDEQRALDFAKELLKEGILVFSARYPTVQKGKAILRLSLTASHRQEDISCFIKKINKVRKRCQ